MILFLYHMPEFIKKNQQKNETFFLQIFLNLFVKTGSMESIFLKTQIFNSQL